jgi:acetylornithine deacetylase
MKRGLFMYRNIVNNWVDEHKEEILNFNRSFVSVPSENRYPTGDEKEVQKLVTQELKNLGCEVDVFLPTEVSGLTEHPAYLEGRHYEERPNVVGTKKGNGDGRSIIFSGHMDTVPKGMDPWSVDPFSGVVKDGKQYGLGVFDMKGGMAASMMALKAIQDLDIQLNGDVIIENVVDEEYGGANGTLACRLRGYEADIAIIPEPTNMAICPVSQGGSMFRFTFQGEGAGRSFSGEELLNPVYTAARFFDILRQFEQHQSQKESTNNFYKDDPGLPALVQGVKAGPVHLPLTDRVPSNCVIDTWIQCFPGTTESELREEFLEFINTRAANDELLNKMPPKIEKLIRFLPGSGIPENHEIVGVTKGISQDLGKDLPVKGAPFACDSFMFNLHSNTPALIWGPKGGNGHSPDEFIYVDEFMELVKMYALTMIKWCGVK